MENISQQSGVSGRGRPVNTFTLKQFDCCKCDQSFKRNRELTAHLTKCHSHASKAHLSSKIDKQQKGIRNNKRAKLMYNNFSNNNDASCDDQEHSQPENDLLDNENADVAAGESDSHVDDEVLHEGINLGVGLPPAHNDNDNDMNLNSDSSSSDSQFDPGSGNLPPTYPFVNFTRGLLAQCFAALSLSRTAAQLIIDCMLTTGFDIEELRETSQSAQTLHRDIQSLTKVMFPHSTETEFEEQVAKRSKQEAQDKRTLENNTSRTQQKFKQKVLSISDYVKMDFANPQVRQFMNFGLDKVADHEAVTEFNQTNFCHEYRRYTELLDFWIKGHRFQVGNFVRLECEDIIRIDELRFRKPAMTYLDAANVTLNVLKKLPSESVRPVLQFYGPIYVSNEQTGNLLDFDIAKWTDCDEIKEMVNDSNPAWVMRDGVKTPYQVLLLDLRVPNVRRDQLVLFISIFIDGFGNSAVNVCMRYDNLKSSRRDSCAFIRTLMVSNKVIPLRGERHALQSLCQEFKDFGPGSDGIQVYDAINKRNTSVVITPSFFIVDIAESYTSLALLGNAAKLYDRYTYASAAEGINTSYDRMDHHNMRRRARAVQATEVMRDELQRINYRPKTAAKDVRTRHGQEHARDKQPWTYDIQLPTDEYSQTPHEFYHLFFANFIPFLLKKQLIKSFSKQDVEDLKAWMTSIPWPARFVQTNFFVGQTGKLCEIVKTWTHNYNLAFAISIVGEQVVAGDVRAKKVYKYFMRVWRLVLRLMSGIAQNDMTEVCLQGQQIVDDGRVLFGEEMELPNHSGLMDYFTRFLPMVGRGSLVSAQAFEASNKEHNQAIAKGGHALTTLATEAVERKTVVRHMLQGGHWGEFNSKKLGSAFRDMKCPRGSNTHPLLKHVMGAEQLASDHIFQWGDDLVPECELPDDNRPWRVHSRKHSKKRVSRLDRRKLYVEHDVNSNDPLVSAVKTQAAAEAGWDDRLDTLLKADNTRIVQVTRLTRVVHGRVYFLTPGDFAWSYYWKDDYSFVKQYIRIDMIAEIVGINGNSLLSVVPAHLHQSETQPEDPEKKCPQVEWLVGTDPCAAPVRLLGGQVMLAHKCTNACVLAARCARHVSGDKASRQVMPMAGNRLEVINCHKCQKALKTVFHKHPKLRAGRQQANVNNDSAWRKDLFQVYDESTGFRPSASRT